MIFNNKLEGSNAIGGGGVAAYQSNSQEKPCSFTMHDGIICGNRSLRTTTAGVPIGAGGVYVRGPGSSFEMIGGVMKNNYAVLYGSAVQIYEYATFKMTDSVICNNTSGVSAGMYLPYMLGDSLIENCRITGNTATSDGGGIYCTRNPASESGTLTSKNTEISGNTAGNGGGIYSTGGHITLENSTVSKNNATASNGGGIYSKNAAKVNGNVTLKNTVVSENNAKTSGGGVYNSSTLTVGGTTQIKENASGTNGGGIYNSDTLTIGGTAKITGKKTGASGGVYGSGTITIGGAAQITGNLKEKSGSQSANKLWLGSGRIITIGTGNDAPVTAGDNKMAVGITMASTGGVGIFTGENSADYHALFTADGGADYKGNTAQFWCADCAVRIFVRLSKNLREYFVYCRGFLGDMTEYYASKMRAVNCAVLP